MHSSIKTGAVLVASVTIAALAQANTAHSARTTVDGAARLQVPGAGGMPGAGGIPGAGGTPGSGGIPGPAPSSGGSGGMGGSPPIGK